MYTIVILSVIVSVLFVAPSISSPVVVSEQLRPPKGLSIDEHQNSLAEFWTADRMKQAKSPEELYPDLFNKQISNASAHSRTIAFKEQVERIIHGSAPSITQDRLAYSGIRPTIGRVFWNVGKGLYGTCSASIIKSVSRDLIVTAGHCVNDGKRFFVNMQWVFVPGYNNGNSPYGIWSARQMTALKAWTQNQYYNADVAMVSLSTLDGLHIQDYLGSNGLLFNGRIYGYTPNLVGPANYITSFGYPVNLDNGQLLEYCYTIPSRSPYKQNSYIGLFIRCDMGGGCSGGPWLNSANQVFSVNSFQITSLTYGNLNGPYFEQTIAHLYDTCKAQ